MLFMSWRGFTQMEHVSPGTRATDPELDEALARAIRQLIADVVMASADGVAPPASAA